LKDLHIAMILPADTLMVIAAPFIGSFVATLAYRLPVDAPVALARSACPSCGETLSPLSLVPVISWMALRGRCRRCRDRISPSYPLVEMAALLLAVWTVWTMTMATGWLLAASCALGWTLLALSLLDARHFILPDVMTLPLGAAGLIVTFAIDPSQFADHLAAAVSSFALLALVNHLYRRVRGEDGLGLGDAKLLAAGGAWVGFDGLAGILLIASFTALAWALFRGVRWQQMSARTRVAFGPFLALGIWIIWLYGPLEFGSAI
jgi:leader peptidase (prepilin peptidase)/N-methyltransferase